MSEVKRYDAVHLRYEENNIRYGEGCEVEVVTATDYAALEAECERMRQALTKIHDRCEAFVGDESGMQVHSVEVLMDIAARGLSAKP